MSAGDEAAQSDIAQLGTAVPVAPIVESVWPKRLEQGKAAVALQAALRADCIMSPDDHRLCCRT